MDEAEPDFHFRFMSFAYKFRDLFLPRREILKETEIKPDFHILDYGCGPGGYVEAAAKLVGSTGKIYALDIHPLAIKTVQNIAFKKKLENVEAICSDCRTGLLDGSIDVVLLYDVFHDLGDPNAVLKELHRVLKSEGVLSFSDHHLKEDEIISKVTGSGLFKFSRKGEKTYSFLREGKIKNQRFHRINRE